MGRLVDTKSMKAAIFKDDSDLELFLNTFAQVTERFHDQPRSDKRLAIFALTRSKLVKFCILLFASLARERIKLCYGSRSQLGFYLKQQSRGGTRFVYATASWNASGVSSES